eukprot:scaffold30021_cov54-Attheya_sp.AAC.2
MRKERIHQRPTRDQHKGSFVPETSTATSWDTSLETVANVSLGNATVFSGFKRNSAPGKGLSGPAKKKSKNVTEVVSRYHNAMPWVPYAYHPIFPSESRMPHFKDLKRRPPGLFGNVLSPNSPEKVSMSWIHPYLSTGKSKQIKREYPPQISYNYKIESQTRGYDKETARGVAFPAIALLIICSLSWSWTYGMS